jgi:hypothetical protein
METAVQDGDGWRKFSFLYWGATASEGEEDPCHQGMARLRVARDEYGVQANTVNDSH